jgi:hypothetical protein
MSDALLVGVDNRAWPYNNGGHYHSRISQSEKSNFIPGGGSKWQRTETVHTISRVAPLILTWLADNVSAFILLTGKFWY